MPVSGVLTQVVDVQLEAAALQRAPHHTDGERAGKHRREDGEDVEAHHPSASGHGVITTVPVSTSTDRTHSRTIG